MGLAIILITVISKKVLQMYFHKMLSFYCTDNLILGVPFWIPRTQFSEYLTV